jgi:hypothetical protein
MYGKSERVRTRVSEAKVVVSPLCDVPVLGLDENTGMNSTSC